MDILHLPLAETGHFSSLLSDYLQGAPALQAFYPHPPTAEGLAKALAERNFPAERRQTLVQSLKNQYQGLKLSSGVSQNIEALGQEKTFTVTTGHQLNIFTGPLYFIYKIVTTIRTCQELQQRYPDYRFVPVYWMASEDHDLAEISHFSLFGKTYQWETQQSGPVGNMQPDGLAQLAEELPEDVPLFREAYAQSPSLAAAVRRYVNDLFGPYGLLVIDADEPALKRSFAPVMQEELLEQTAGRLVVEQSEKLEQAGYKAQIYAREINLFYMKPGLRERIVQEEDTYAVLNTDIRFSKEQLTAELEAHPERFSPNVVLRPLYQEWILPNLGYVGGPAELAYWMQLQPVFHHYNTAFPLLLPRHFALVIGLSQHQRLQKLGFQPSELFKGLNQLQEELVARESEADTSLSDAEAELRQAFALVRKKVLAVDGSLEGFIGAEENKALKSLENIEKRLKKAEERKHETSLRQLEHVYDKLFPQGGLQERSENFMNFWLNDPKFIDRLMEAFQPFDYRFHILTYDGNES
jgi:bacillithiol biosynthesis cysteine-adding enzyme BshC